MIIFYDKKTGEITGTIYGRVHDDSQLNMWVGDEKTTDRLIINWIPVRWYTAEGKKVGEKDKRARVADFEPDIEDDDQKKIFIKLDKSPQDRKNYKVDLSTKKLKIAI